LCGIFMHAHDLWYLALFDVPRGESLVE
jgi:hypothetical protein